MQQQRIRFTAFYHLTTTISLLDFHVATGSTYCSRTHLVPILSLSPLAGTAQQALSLTVI